MNYPEPIQEALDKIDEKRRKIEALTDVVEAAEKAVEHCVDRNQPEHRPIVEVEHGILGPHVDVNMYANGRADVAEMLRALGIHGIRRSKAFGSTVTYSSGCSLDVSIYLRRASDRWEAVGQLGIVFSDNAECRKVPKGTRTTTEYEVVCGEGGRL